METKTSSTIQKHGSPCNLKKDNEDLSAAIQLSAANLLVLVPAYNHAATPGRVLPELSAVNLPVPLVEDGRGHDLARPEAWESLLLYTYDPAGDGHLAERKLAASGYYGVSCSA